MSLCFGMTVRQVLGLLNVHVPDAGPTSCSSQILLQRKKQSYFRCNDTAQRYCIKCELDGARLAGCAALLQQAGSTSSKARRHPPRSAQPGAKLHKAQRLLRPCNPMDCSPSGSSVQGILQARILEWVAIPFSRVSSQPRN